jgi:hypothetical protein
MFSDGVARSSVTCNYGTYSQTPLSIASISESDSPPLDTNDFEYIVIDESVSGIVLFCIMDDVCDIGASCVLRITGADRGEPLVVSARSLVTRAVVGAEADQAVPLAGAYRPLDPCGPREDRWHAMTRPVRDSDAYRGCVSRVSNPTRSRSATARLPRRCG